LRGLIEFREHGVEGARKASEFVPSPSGYALAQIARRSHALGGRRQFSNRLERGSRNREAQ
jgi:hypothetical protein